MAEWDRIVTVDEAPAACEALGDATHGKVRADTP